MSKNIILCGVGGQGTILASRLIATAAMDKNIPIKTAETIGMAQRGGSVFSHLETASLPEKGRRSGGKQQAGYAGKRNDWPVAI